MNGSNKKIEPIVVFILDENDNCGMINEDVKIDMMDVITKGRSIDGDRLRRALVKISI